VPAEVHVQTAAKGTYLTSINTGSESKRWTRSRTSPRDPEPHTARQGISTVGICDGDTFSNKSQYGDT
jgi:hypothetical protein